MPAVLPDHMRLHAVLGGEESVTAGDWATAFWSSHILQVFLGVNIETATSRESGTAPWNQKNEEF